MVGACEGGTWRPALSGTASVITRKFVSCPVIVRMLLVKVARLESELLHATPSITVLSVLPPLGVGLAGGTVENVTLNTPSVIVFVPVAPDPGTETRENENVPEAPVDVSELTVMVPLPMPTPACQPAAGLPIYIWTFAALVGPSVYTPVPVAVGASAKPIVVLFALSVPPSTGCRSSKPRWPTSP